MSMTIKESTLKTQTLIGALAGPIIFALITFISAGTIKYWQGWFYSGLAALVLLVNYLILRKNTELINERFHPGSGMKSWDKIFFAVSTPFYFITIILGGLDAGRFGWSPQLPASLYWVGAILFLVGHGIFLWAKWTNRFFSSVVRIQTERNHTVCQNGPYRIVRHPGYTGSLLYGLVTPLILGSLWAFIPNIVLTIALIVRTYLEDKTLQAELPGYKDFTNKTPYRLIPGIW